MKPQIHYPQDPNCECNRLECTERRRFMTCWQKITYLLNGDLRDEMVYVASGRITRELNITTRDSFCHFPCGEDWTKVHKTLKEAKVSITQVL